jgi:catechol 2,3-dioxygenase-like lactoylglutathione lyase family enzyme
MRPYLRLRQVCLAAPHLEASAALIRALLGLQACHRDAGVAQYGLENVVFPIGPDRFLEVVSPTRAGTAAGRFLALMQGRGGYMLIFDCDDPKARVEHAQTLGVRLANHIDRERYQGYQLHPKDCRATFLEFNHTVGGEDARGPYWPAGEDWQRFVRSELTCRLDGVEVLSHDPAGLAQHWSHILGVPALVAGDRHIIGVDAQRIAICGAPGVARERLDAMVLTVRGAVGILARARQMGLETRQDGFALCGVWIKLAEDGA